MESDLEGGSFSCPISNSVFSTEVRGGILKEENLGFLRSVPKTLLSKNFFRYIRNHYFQEFFGPVKNFLYHSLLNVVKHLQNMNPFELLKDPQRSLFRLKEVYPFI